MEKGAVHIREKPGSRARRGDALFAAAALLTLALVLLAALQYDWLREIASAQRARMQADARARAAAIAQDIDREITRAFLMLHVDPETARTRDASRYAERVREYQKTAAWPALVRDTLLYEKDAQGRATLLRFSPATGKLEPAEWPAGLEDLRQKVEALPSLHAIDVDVPALVAPVPEFVAGVATGGSELQKLPHMVNKLILRHRPPDKGSGRCTILVLDRRQLLDEIAPSVVRRRLADGGAAAEYDASFVDARNGRVLRGEAASGAVHETAGDARADLLRIRLDEIDSAILRAFVPDVLRPNEPRPRMSIRLIERWPDDAAAGPWQVVLRHKRGSVEQAVAATLRRNLAVTASILAVLGGGVVLLALAARRARALAERQMEFVAGVTHELRTPLAVIRSAADNLADGVIAEPVQVRRYGGLIKDEGVRLSGMVEQVLSFAGADVRARPSEPVDVATVVERALAAEAVVNGSFAVEREIASDLPPVFGDAAALERAVSNLVSNARKYGAAEGPVRIRAAAPPAGARREVVIAVEDRGPGIDPAEGARLFEPFFRGKRARDAQVPGSGLGLAVVRRIVEAHGGRVEVDSRAGEGARFRLVLPAAPATALGGAPDAQTHPAG
jgi:signal transduction histidine kinase